MPMLETNVDHAVVLYHQALIELKQLAALKDFTPEGERTYSDQFLKTKRLYLAACPPECIVEFFEKPANRVDDAVVPEKSSSRRQVEYSFAFYIAGCLAHADCLNFGGDTEEIFLNAARIITACLSQLPPEDAPELPFDW